MRKLYRAEHNGEQVYVNCLVTQEVGKVCMFEAAAAFDGPASRVVVRVTTTPRPDFDSLCMVAQFYEVTGDVCRYYETWELDESAWIGAFNERDPESKGQRLVEQHDSRDRKLSFASCDERVIQDMCLIRDMFGELRAGRGVDPWEKHVYAQEEITVPGPFPQEATYQARVPGGYGTYPIFSDYRFSGE